MAHLLVINPEYKVLLIKVDRIINISEPKQLLLVGIRRLLWERELVMIIDSIGAILFLEKNQFKIYIKE
jgi:hypothetical protein